MKNSIKREFLFIIATTYRVVFLVYIVLASFVIGNVSAYAQDTTCHTVRSGETLTSIAARYGVSVSAIMRTARISNPNSIRVGQQLCFVTSSVNADVVVTATPANVSPRPTGTPVSVERMSPYSAPTPTDEGSSPGVRATPTAEGSLPGVRATPTDEGSSPGVRATPTDEGSLPGVRATPTAEGSLPGVRATPAKTGPAQMLSTPTVVPTVASERVPTQSSTIYIVRRGDSLLRISRLYGVSVSQLMSYNNLNSTTIYTGQTIRIPSR